MRAARVMRALLLRTLALASALLAPRATDAACADTVLARAVKRYAITGSSPQTYTESCTLAVVAGRRYLVEVLRPTGGPSGTFARVVYQGSSCWEPTTSAPPACW